jgi:hypothetical protein
MGVSESNCVRVASRVPVTITVSTVSASATRLNDSGSREIARVFCTRRAMIRISPWKAALYGAFITRRFQRYTRDVRKC